MSESESEGSSVESDSRAGMIRSVVQAKPRSPPVQRQSRSRSRSRSPKRFRNEETRQRYQEDDRDSSDSDEERHGRRNRWEEKRRRNRNDEREDYDRLESKDENTRLQQEHDERKSNRNRDRGDYDRVEHKVDNARRRRDQDEQSGDSGNAESDEDKTDKFNRHEENEMNIANSKKTGGEIANPPKRKPEIDLTKTRAGGAYIPPAKLRMMQESIEDKSSAAYQRLSWEALKKSINGLINKVNTANIGFIVRELFNENIVRGRGPLAQSIIRAQAASSIFTNVYSALVSVINTKFPKIGELILRRLILQFRRAYKRNDKPICISAAQFIAHLVNQQVAHEILALELLTLLMQQPTDDSVEVAIGFLKESAMKLTEVSPRGVNAVFERLRNILHDGQIDKRVQYMIEVMFAIRKDGFKEHPAIVEGLDLVEESDQITHLLRMECEGTAEDLLNVFKLDPDFLENEEKYKEIRRDILGEEADSDASSDDDDDDDDDDEEEQTEEAKMDILDQTESNLVALRRTIYLTIQSSLDFEGCAHKMLKMNIKPTQMGEVCSMIIDCCAQQRSYEKFFGLLGQRFCQIKKEFMEEFVRLFKEQYDTIHRLETNKLRNVAKFSAHLLFTDAIPWTVLSCINLNEDDTTSSSRIFIKILFQELAEYMGLSKLNERLRDPFVGEYCEGIFPRDNPRNTRFSINFFTSIGLGGLTEDLREHLKNAPKKIMSQKHAEVSDSDSDESSEDSSSSESSDSEEEKRKKGRSKRSSKKSHKDSKRKRRK